MKLLLALTALLFAVPAAALLDAGPETRFGLHPAMAPLHELQETMTDPPQDEAQLT